MVTFTMSMVHFGVHTPRTRRFGAYMFRENHFLLLVTNLYIIDRLTKALSMILYDTNSDARPRRGVHRSSCL